MNFIIVVLIVCSTVVCLVDSKASKCYTCFDSNCENLKEEVCNSSYPLWNDFVCWSSRQTIGDVETQQKMCLPTDEAYIAQKVACDQLNKVDNSWCYICDTDLCNSAGTYTFSAFLILSLTILISKAL